MIREIDEAQAKKLLKLARESIRNRLNERNADSVLPDEASFADLAATFVTLKLAGQLRGCIGSLKPVDPLGESIRKNAINAAFHDSRFRPLTEEEFDSIHIDISILTEPYALDYVDGEDLIRQLRPEKDGVILRQGRNCATFLPQVWEQLPTPELFLGHLCKKAGLSETCWREDHPEIDVYQVQCFAEEKE